MQLEYVGELTDHHTYRHLVYDQWCHSPDLHKPDPRMLLNGRFGKCSATTPDASPVASTSHQRPRNAAREVPRPRCRQPLQGVR